jgi:hypothetical protein
MSIRTPLAILALAALLGAGCLPFLRMYGSRGLAVTGSAIRVSFRLP